MGIAGRGINFYIYRDLAPILFIYVKDEQHFIIQERSGMYYLNTFADTPIHPVPIQVSRFTDMTPKGCNNMINLKAKNGHGGHVARLQTP
ncbi:predicted protein [Lichtheimia corymbifera JMRC:FSU:9682]|uniref:Uncharacterized protein n=1 Tax=Lichtheimia corymbifera JMRC:FSU:9682 TaxID=1263082 RepID=A0A068SEE5_9FUNG|nr:predicted protein [Lichtheimia corymbifera JMRC:FSU:9682]